MNKDYIVPGCCIVCSEGSESWRVLELSPFRGADGGFSDVALISLGLRELLPIVISLDQLKARVATGQWALTTRNLAPPSVLCIEDVPLKRRDKFQRIMDRNYGLIRPVLSLGWDGFFARMRNEKIAEIARLAPTSISRVKELLIIYWRSGGSIFCLGPNYSKCGSPSRLERLQKSIREKAELVLPVRTGPNIIYDPLPESQVGACARGGCALPLDAVPFIKNAVKAYFEEPTKKAVIRISMKNRRAFPWRDIKLWTQSRLDSDPRFAGLRPSKRQLKWIAKDVKSLHEVLGIAMGARHTKLNHRSKSGDYRDVTWGVGSLYEVDPHVTDIELVEEESLMPAGRGRLNFVVDRASTMITGAYATSDDADFGNVGLALNCSFSNKENWLRENLGMEVGPDAWPCEGVCDMLSADNLELAGKAALLLPELVGDVGLARPYRGDDKPQVEVSFALGNGGFVHHFGYGIVKGPAVRCEVSPRGEARITRSAYLRSLYNWIINDHSNRPFSRDRELPPDFINFCSKEKRLMTPKEYWGWSIERQHGPLKKYDPAVMFPRLLDSAPANVTDYGFELDGLVFEMPKVELYKLKMSEARWVGVTKITVHFDRISTNQVFIISKDAKMPPIRCPLARISRNYVNLTWEAAKQRIKIKNILIRKTERVHDEKCMEVREAVTKEARLADDAVKQRYGSLKRRNKIAASLDVKKTNEIQVEHEQELHRLTQVVPVSELVKAPVEIKSVRPKMYE